MSQMALQLDRYSFTHISVDAVQATDLEDLGEGLLTEDDFEIELQAIPDKDSEYSNWVQLAVSNDGDPHLAMPYKIRVEGLIKVNFENEDEELTKEQREDIAVVNGSLILYGAMRDRIFMLTSSMVYGPMQLPLIYFSNYQTAVDES